MSLLILGGFAALGSVTTRSILGGVLAGFGLSVLKPISLVIPTAVSRLTNWPSVVNLYRFAATYHLDNAWSWIATGAPLPPPTAGFTAQYSYPASLLALAVWLLIPILIASGIFRQQDITS